MNIDITSFFFNSTIEGATATCAWGTSIGQSKSKECRIETDSFGVNDFLAGLVYKSKSDIENFDLSKGSKNREYLIRSIFDKVFVNGIRVKDKSFIVLLARENTASHPGRLIISYPPYASYKNDKVFMYVSNEATIAEMFNVLECKQSGCWFSYDISVVNQDELHFSCVVVNKDHDMVYRGKSSERSAKWASLIPAEEHRSLAVKIFSSFTSRQIIYYGAPGTGKSHATNEVTSKYPETVRTTFHPDSDYSTFVGAYKPTRVEKRKSVVIGEDEKAVRPLAGESEHEEKISYKFVKQAFLKAYVKAWQLFKETCVDGGELAPQFLVIEEINRGNCAQIFGDLFQLLDRKNGISEYPIEADEDIRKTLLEEKPEDGLSFGKDGLSLSAEQIQYINQFYDNERKHGQQVAEKICKGQLLVLPPNLYIWATMNTSDQSLFPIDSAFKRRWEWKYVRICEGKDKNKQPLNYRIQFITQKGEKADVSWWEFIQAINTKIEDATKSEDKKLGYFFCKPDKRAEDAGEKDDNTIISAEKFVGKVVFYLWQDVFKDYGFKSDIFKKDDGKRLAFHDFYPDNIEPDEEKNPEGIDLDLVKRFIEKVVNKKIAKSSESAESESEQPQEQE